LLPSETTSCFRVQGPVWTAEEHKQHKGQRLDHEPETTQSLLPSSTRRKRRKMMMTTRMTKRSMWDKKTTKMTTFEGTMTTKSSSSSSSKATTSEEGQDHNEMPTTTMHLPLADCSTALVRWRKYFSRFTNTV